MHKTIIIGAGTSGLTAAIYMARANLRPLVITGLGTSSHLKASMELDSFPGFPNGVRGPELLDNMRKQAERFGAELLSGRASRVDLSGRPFTVWLEGGRTLQAETIVVSTGISAKYLGIPGEKEFIGRGVYSCATCSGFFFHNKKVVVVGGEDKALEEAIYLTRFAGEVAIVTRDEQAHASDRLLEAARSQAKIVWHCGLEAVEVVGGEKGIGGLKVAHTGSGRTEIIPADAVFVAVGVSPNTAFLENQLPADERGFLRVKPGTMETDIPGVFVCGDVQDRKYREAVTAAGTGCMAALDCERYLMNAGK